MTRQHVSARLVIALVLVTLAAQPSAAGQIAIEWVERMPRIPEPFDVRDWQAVARNYDRLAFDPDATGPYLPLVWLVPNVPNRNGPGFGLPSYVGLPGGGLRHEAINTIAAVLGASLVGIDKTAGPHNWVRMCRQYIDPETGLVLNGVRASTGRSFWYELWPSVLFYGLADCHGDESGLLPACRGIGDSWAEAVEALRPAGGGAPDFDHSAFNFRTMQAVDHGRRREPDSAGGVAWILLAAHQRWGDPKHLEAARACLAFLDGRASNPYYEVLLPWGALAAARANAQHGADHNVGQILTWCLDGRRTPRGSWGTVCERWGTRDCHGLVGSLTDRGGYAFAMNTFAQPAALVPLVRYDDRFARAVGRYVLSAASAARLFYPGALPEDHQSCPGWKADPASCVAYEGLRKQWDGKRPYATGDVVRRNKGPTDLGLYGSSHVGLFAALIARTGDQHILRLDCLATDFHRPPAYPTYLYYNPHNGPRQVKLDVGAAPCDLYNAAGNRWIVRGVRGKASVTVPADAAVLAVVCPAGGAVTRNGPRLLVDGVVVDYRADE